MGTIKVICWDVYGTLLAAQRGDLDSLLRRAGELRAAFADTIRHFALPAAAELLHRDFLAGITSMRAAKVAAGVAHPEIRIEELWAALLPGCPARAVALYFERQANPKQLMPGARETLAALQKRGCRQGIISNAQFYTPIELRELLGEDFFDPALTFFSCDLGVAKPDLTGFRLVTGVLARDGITPAECLFVGDSPGNDIAPARQAGFQAVLFGPTGDIQQLPQLLERL
jgi:putative hydrolase of the HAD superfamily